MRGKLAKKHISITRLASTASGFGVDNTPQSLTPQAMNAWDTPLELDTGSSISIEPHIGWLKELGLDFGWGPTALSQWFLEHVYVYTGLPWAGTAILATVIFRLAAIKLFLNASDTTARNASLEPLTKPWMDKMQEARRNQDQTAMLEAWSQQSKIKKQYGVKTSTMLIPMLVQAPLGYGMYRLTRNMASLPVPGLDTSRFLWISDLTVADPLFLLPAAGAAILYFLLKVILVYLH